MSMVVIEDYGGGYHIKGSKGCGYYGNGGGHGGNGGGGHGGNGGGGHGVGYGYRGGHGGNGGGGQEVEIQLPRGIIPRTV